MTRIHLKEAGLCVVLGILVGIESVGIASVIVVEPFFFLSYA